MKIIHALAKTPRNTYNSTMDREILRLKGQDNNVISFDKAKREKQAEEHKVTLSAYTYTDIEQKDDDE